MNDGFMDNVNTSGEAYMADGDNLVLNLDEVDESKTGFEALPAGIYSAIIESTEFGPSKNSGSPMITWQFKVSEGEYTNRILFYHTTLNQEIGLANLKKIIRTCVPQTQMAGFSPKRFCDNGEALGMPCRLKVKIEMYQGEKRNRVQEVLPPEAAGAFMDA